MKVITGQIVSAIALIVSAALLGDCAASGGAGGGSERDTVSAGDSSCRIQYIREVDHQAVAEELAEREIEEPFIRLNRDR
ncbi:MAG TPA: hypothetical protein VKO85_10840 [Wenzhouxiangellaceae bacterium]|nr:hypothetical protein [Wenzhouxiangellaceae bacterium]